MQTNEFEAQVRRTFAAMDPKVKVRWDHTLNYPCAIRGKLTTPSAEEPKEIASLFLQSHKALFKIQDPQRQLKLDRVKLDNKGNSRSYFHQLFNDLPVWGGYIAVFTDAHGVVTAFEAKYHTKIDVKIARESAETVTHKDYEKKLISPKKALDIAQKHSGGHTQGEPFLLIYPHEGRYRLAYHVEVSGSEGNNPADWVYFVDAFTGQIIHRYNTIDFAAMVDGSGIGINLDETAASPERNFRVFHDDDGNYYLRNTEYSPEIHLCDIAGGGAHNGYAGRDDLAMDSDGQWDDCNNASRVDNQRPEAEGYWALHRIVDYFSRDQVVNGIHLFNRNGWDDAGGDWRMVVHYREVAGADYNVSFWSRNSTHGLRVYHGDGDGVTRTYKAALDASAHEWTHGLQYAEVAAPAPGTNPGFDGSLPAPFAIKEATADTIGCIVEAGWHMREDFEASIYFAGALRSLENPPAYGDSDHMEAAADGAGAGWQDETTYSNSTILSHAFYLMAMGGRHPVGIPGYDEISVIGEGVGFVENILYRYLVHHAAAQDTLQDFRDKVIQSCADLYPGDACKEWCVKRAFDAVGLYDDAVGGVTALPAGVNLNITPWGAKNGQAPHWQSPDVYCLDESDTIVEPKKNQINRLIAVVRNQGSAAANGTTVNFYYSPFGMGYRHEDFKFIGSDTIDVPADGSDVPAEVSWDLTDLSDDFGGVWPSPIEDFDHFCMRVEVVHPDEIYPCDNSCQHNFTNVDTVPDADRDGVWKFLIANPFPEPAWAMIHMRSTLPGSMKYGLRLFGDEKIPLQEMPEKPRHLPKNVHLVPLAARQKRVAELRIFIPRKEALQLAKRPGGRGKLKSLSLAVTIGYAEFGGIEVGFFGKDLWNIPKKKPEVPAALEQIGLEGKVHSLSYNDRGEFIGFTLRFTDGTKRYFESISERIEERLSKARSEDRFVAVKLNVLGRVATIIIDGR